MSKEIDGMGRTDGKGWDRWIENGWMGWDGMGWMNEWDGMEWDGMEWDGMDGWMDE